jgi:transcriptional regulator with XRE-family HTH domain
MDMHKIFVENLERHRIAAKMTKRTLVERSGLSSTFVFQILRCEGSPSLRSLEQLASAVNASLAELLTPPQDTPPQKTGKRPKAPPGLELVTAALPPEKAFLVRRWEADARKPRQRG